MKADKDIKIQISSEYDAAGSKAAEKALDGVRGKVSATTGATKRAIPIINAFRIGWEKFAHITGGFFSLISLLTQLWNMMKGFYEWWTKEDREAAVARQERLAEEKRVLAELLAARQAAWAAEQERKEMAAAEALLRHYEAQNETLEAKLNKQREGVALAVQEAAMQEETAELQDKLRLARLAGDRAAGRMGEEEYAAEVRAIEDGARRRRYEAERGGYEAQAAEAAEEYAAYRGQKDELVSEKRRRDEALGALRTDEARAKDWEQIRQLHGVMERMDARYDEVMAGGGFENAWERDKWHAGRDATQERLNALTRKDMGEAEVLRGLGFDEEARGILQHTVTKTREVMEGASNALAGDIMELGRKMEAAQGRLRAAERGGERAQERYELGGAVIAETRRVQDETRAREAAVEAVAAREADGRAREREAQEAAREAARGEGAVSKGRAEEGLRLARERAGAEQQAGMAAFERLLERSGREERVREQLYGWLMGEKVELRRDEARRYGGEFGVMNGAGFSGEQRGDLMGVYLEWENVRRQERRVREAEGSLEGMRQDEVMRGRAQRGERVRELEERARGAAEAATGAMDEQAGLSGEVVAAMGEMLGTAQELGVAVASSRAEVARLRAENARLRQQVAGQGRASV